MIRLLFTLAILSVPGMGFGQDDSSSEEFLLDGAEEAAPVEAEEPPLEVEEDPLETEEAPATPAAEEQMTTPEKPTPGEPADSTALPDSFDNGSDDNGSDGNTSDDNTSDDNTSDAVGEETDQQGTQPEPETPAESAASAPAGSTSSSAGETTSAMNSYSSSKRMFGSYRIRLAATKPNFLDLEGHQELYGTPNWHPSFAADWFAFDWFLTFGLSLRAGFYSKKGQTSSDNETITPLEGAETTLTLVPTQALLTAEFTPFTAKWLVLDGWAGVEGLYFQEVRSTGSSDESTSSTTASTTASTAKDDTGAKTNRGWKTGFVFGGALNILLNPLDEQSVKSMEGVMGLGYVYLSPFVEYVETIEKGVSFSRAAYGVGFTFESVR